MGRLALSLLLVSSFLFAQANFGTISGVIQDASHAPVVGAQISLKADETGASRTVASNGGGVFEAVDLAPGEYTVRVNAPGMTTAVRLAKLEVGQNLSL